MGGLRLEGWLHIGLRGLEYQGHSCYGYFIYTLESLGNGQWEAVKGK